MVQTHRFGSIYCGGSILYSNEYLIEEDMEIVVLGTGCPNCKTTYDRVAKVIESMENKPTLRKEEDILEIVKYNIMSLPAVVVDGEVVIKGIVPSEEEIRKVITI